MILLSGHSLTQERRVPMEALSLQLKERDSTASMVPTDMTGINAESWFLDDVSPGGGIVYRVSGIQTSYTVATITVKLEHVINTLRDKVIFGEITPADITGNPNAERCSAEQAVRFILADQSDWRLGTFGYNVSDPYKFDGETLYDALVKISNSLEDCWWSYDMSQYPFVLNMTPKPAGVACELRPGRNLSAITKNVDKSGMYTRFYPVGKDDLHIPGEYVSRNEHLYGTVSKIEVDQSIDDPSELYEWAVDRLKKHAEPNVNITADGIELADATGETLDRLTLGRICRIPLTEFDTIIEERIVGLDYSDKVHQPEKVRITMSNQKDDAQHDLVHVLASNIKATSKGQRTSTRQQKNDHAWIEDTNDHVALCAEGIVGVDAQGKPNWTILSQLVVDGTGVHQSVQEIQRGNVIRDTRIEENERSITLEANNRADADNELQGKITVEADRITQEVTQRQNGDEALSGRITVEAGKITQIVSAVGADGEVTAASIVLAINATGESEAHIDANKVYIGNEKSTTVIDGKLSTNRLASAISALDYVTTKSLSAKKFWLYDSPDETTNTVNVASTALRTAALTLSGNTYYLHLYAIDGTECVSTKNNAMSFSRATTLGGTWSGGKLTVKATPQNNQITFAIFDVTGQDVTWTGRTGEITVYSNVDDGETKYDIGKKLTVTAPIQTQTFGQAWSNGKLTITANPSNSTTTAAIFDLTGQDVTWSGRTATISVYANRDDGETKIDTGKRLTLTAPIQTQTYGHSWSGGTLTVTGNPSGSTTTAAIFDLTNQDVSWSGRTATITVYANRDGGETKTDTGKRLTLTAPIQSQSYSHSWASGICTVTGQPSGSTTTVGIFDLTSGDVSWSGRTGTITVYANKDGGETKTDTGKRLTVTAPVQTQTYAHSWSSGTLTVTGSPSGSTTTAGIFDLTSGDVSWSGRTGTIAVYANKDGGETKTDTGKRLTVTAPIQTQSYSHSWSNGTLTVTGAPSGSTTTAAIFDLTSGDVSWSGRTGTIAVYANKDGGETKTDTGKRLTVTAPIQSQSFSHSWSGGTLTVSASPSGSETYVGIFDLRSQDISWSGRNATITVYANKDNGETRYDTGKRLYLTAPIQHNMVWQSWSNGILTMTTDPGGDVYTAGIFDLRGQDVSWDGYTATIALYANADGGETRYDTGKRLTLEATSAYYNGVDAGHADFTAHTFAKVFNTNDTIYHGKFYDSQGRALTSQDYYWFGINYNYGGSNASVDFYTYNPS